MHNSISFVDYKADGIYESNSNKNFDDIDPISITVRDFAWSDCAALTQRAARELLGKAKSMGAAAVYNLKFESDNGMTTEPTCSTGWGWFALDVVGGLGPWVKTVHVAGTAANIIPFTKTTRIADGPSDAVQQDLIRAKALIGKPIWLRQTAHVIYRPMPDGKGGAGRFS